MSSRVSVILYIAAMVAVITTVDIAAFRDFFLGRLLANIGLVLLFGAFYLRYFGRP